MIVATTYQRNGARRKALVLTCWSCRRLLGGDDLLGRSTQHIARRRSDSLNHEPAESLEVVDPAAIAEFFLVTQISSLGQKSYDARTLTTHPNQVDRDDIRRF